jgi:hypothetical protein
MRRIAIQPRANSARNNMAAVSALGGTVCVLIRNRRLAKDFESTIKSSAAWLLQASDLAGIDHGVWRCAINP